MLYRLLLALPCFTWHLMPWVDQKSATVLVVCLCGGVLANINFVIMLLWHQLSTLHIVNQLLSKSLKSVDSLHQLEGNFLLLNSCFQVTYFLYESLVILFLDADFWDLLLPCRYVFAFFLNSLVLNDLEDEFIFVEHFIKVLKPLLEQLDLLDCLSKYQHYIGQFHLTKLTAQLRKINEVFVVAGFVCNSFEVVLDSSFKVLLVLIGLSNHVADTSIWDMGLDLIQCLSRGCLSLLIALLRRLQ